MFSIGKAKYIAWYAGLIVAVLGAGDLKVPGSITARFVHESLGGGSIGRTRGNLALNRSRAFRINMQAPYRQRICNYRSGVDVIDYRDQVVVRYDVGSLLDLMQVLKVAEHVRGNLYRSRYHGFRFKLWVNTKGEVAKLAFRDKQGGSNTVWFSGIHYNTKPLPSSTFRCKAPQSYRVIHGKL